MRPRWRVLLVGFIAATLPAPAAAEATSCSVTAIGAAPGNCRYRASGPGVYEVRTISGFRIMASADEGVSWRTLVAQTAIPNQPLTGIAIREGTIATAAGDLVDVSIGITWMDTSQGRHRYQDGTLEASSSPDP